MTLLYRNFRLLILTILLIFVWGFSSFQGLPRLEDPELTPRAAVVRTFFPGASADRVEALVTEVLEEEIAEVEEVDTFTARRWSTMAFESQCRILPHLPYDTITVGHNGTTSAPRRRLLEYPPK